MNLLKEGYNIEDYVKKLYEELSIVKTLNSGDICNLLKILHNKKDNLSNIELYEEIKIVKEKYKMVLNFGTKLVDNRIKTTPQSEYRFIELFDEANSKINEILKNF